MALRGRETTPFWRVAGWPLAISLVCVLAGWLVGKLQEELPASCDFGCAMAHIGWQDYLSYLLLGGGLVAFGVFVLVCLFIWVSAAVNTLLDLWR